MIIFYGIVLIGEDVTTDVFDSNVLIPDIGSLITIFLDGIDKRATQYYCCCYHYASNNILI